MITATELIRAIYNCVCAEETEGKAILRCTINDVPLRNTLDFNCIRCVPTIEAVTGEILSITFDTRSLNFDKGSRFEAAPHYLEASLVADLILNEGAAKIRLSGSRAWHTFRFYTETPVDTTTEQFKEQFARVL